MQSVISNMSTGEKKIYNAKAGGRLPGAFKCPITNKWVITVEDLNKAYMKPRVASLIKS